MKSFLLTAFILLFAPLAMAQSAEGVFASYKVAEIYKALPSDGLEQIKRKHTTTSELSREVLLAHNLGLGRSIYKLKGQKFSESAASVELERMTDEELWVLLDLMTQTRDQLKMAKVTKSKF